MKFLWYFLLAYLFPAVEPDDFAPEPDDLPPDDDDTPPPDDDDNPAPDDDDEPVPPADDEPAPAPRISRAQKAIIDARARAQQAERELAEARAELNLSRRGPQQPQQPSADQLLWQQEEETLRNPEATDWQKYAVQANRSARMAQANSQNALQRAEDLADKTQFAALAATKPKLYAAYKDRVEEKLKDLRAKGNNAPREGLLALMVGEDMLAGKIKTAKGAAKPAAAPRASARSDVQSSGTGRLSDAEKRAKRLENVRI
jgi:hypothetical protein